MPYEKSDLRVNRPLTCESDFALVVPSYKRKLTVLEINALA
jgi:hypothetical protein